ncbi:MAG: hypothetical protein R3B72_26015 [Polyangiaceae bacterium]
MSDEHRKDLRLVKPEEAIEPEALARATAALRSAVVPEPLDAMDHEALLAMTLGDDVADVSAAERAAAAELCEAIAGRGAHPLADLARALRATQAAATPAPEDDLVDLDLLVAIAVGDVGLEVTGVERAASDRLRDALAGGDLGHPDARLAVSLRAAGTPAALAAEDADALLALGVGVEAEASPESQREAAALADGLAAMAVEGELGPVVTALRAAAGKLPGLDAFTQRRLEKAALDRRGKARPAAILGAIVALAAGIALFIGSLAIIESGQGNKSTARTEAAELLEARSTEELFDPAEPFPARGGESERMGRIVEARAADLRANRFAAWGVR